MKQRKNPPEQIRTSLTDPIYVTWLAEELPGKIGITIAPGRHGGSKSGARWARDLGADLDALVGRDKMSCQVCLLEDDELVRLRIPNLFEEAGRRGVTVRRAPIKDGGTPPSVEELRGLIDDVVKHARAGEHVVIHCMGGLGRAGTVGGMTLVALGLSAEQALARLVERRGRRCPENEAQRAAIRDLAARLHHEQRPVVVGAPSQPGVLRRTYAIRSWRTWDDELHTFACEFKERFGVFPNILLASTATLRQIDMAAKKQHIVDAQGAAAPIDEPTPLAAFNGPGYTLEFCIEEKVRSRAVSLVYDSCPGGGEPLPDDDTPDEVAGQRATFARPA